MPCINQNIGLAVFVSVPNKKTNIQIATCVNA